jgi:glycosyltransferase involved in cell wall biosynthesis
LTYFGFIQQRKGLHHVLDVLKILRERQIRTVLLVLGDLSSHDPYHKSLLDRIAGDAELQRAVKVLGYLDPEVIADHLAMSDACVLPFVDGVHPKRGSFLAALAQGTFTVTTSDPPRGYVADQNVYYSRPGDVEAMALAVQRHGAPRGQAPRARTWEAVAHDHLALFDRLLRS